MERVGFDPGIQVNGMRNVCFDSSMSKLNGIEEEGLSLGLDATKRISSMESVYGGMENSDGKFGDNHCASDLG